MKTLSLLAFAATLLAPAAAFARNTSPAVNAARGTAVAMTKNQTAKVDTRDLSLGSNRIQAQAHQLGATN